MQVSRYVCDVPENSRLGWVGVGVIKEKRVEDTYITYIL